MGRKSIEELDMRVVGALEPIHRGDDKHPVTGLSDALRRTPGERFRLEQLEFNVGHVICGHMFDDGTHCTEYPSEGRHRCSKHDRKGDPNFGANAAAAMNRIHEKRFRHCNECGNRDCEWFTPDQMVDTCVIERDLFEELMSDADKVEASGKMAQATFVSLVWDTILLDRIMRTLAVDGLLVDELKNYVIFEDDLKPIINSVAHPLLPHVTKLQQSASQLATILELTPKEQARKTKDADDGDAAKAFYALMRSSNVLRKEHLAKDEHEKPKSMGYMGFDEVTNDERL